MLKRKLTNLSRIRKQTLMIASDIIILVFSIWFSFALRMGNLWSDRIDSNLWIFIVIPIISIPLFVQFGLYKSVLKFMGTKVIVSVFQAISVTSLTLVFFMMIFLEIDFP